MQPFTLDQLASQPRDDAEREVRSRVQTAYLGDNVLLARVLGRYKMFLRTDDRGFACHVMLDGFWEMWLTQFIARRVKRGMTAFDVGANFGYYSLLMSELVGDAGRVVAVEPNPAAAALLGESLALNGFSEIATVQGVALGRNEGVKGQLFVPVGEPKNASVAVAGGGRPGQSVEVEIRSFDALAQGLAAVDFVKIDAEGAEADILDGMSDTIARCRPMIVLEFNASRLRNPEKTLNLLLSHYGQIFEISFRGSLVEVSAEELATSSLGHDRLLFVSVGSSG